MKSVESECNLETFQLFLQEEEKATNTIQSYLHAVKTYFQAHPDLTNRGVLAWKGELTQKYSIKTVNQRIIAIKKYASFCGIPISVKTIKEQSIFNNENVITDEQYHHLMCCLKSDEDWQWYYNILIIAKTGTRISEAIKLKKIDALNGFATLRTKGKVRTILFPLSLREELSDYLATLGDYDYLLQSNKTKGDKSISKGAVNKALKRFAERYQIQPRVMHPHSLRHHFGIKVMQKTSDISYVADLMGHENISTTRIYTQQSISQQQERLDSAVDW